MARILVLAFANWRLTIPALAKQYRVIAPDMVGFGFTKDPKNIIYNMDNWLKLLTVL